MRNLILILGDQLALDNSALKDFDPALDRILMIESPDEATHVWSHKARIVLFLSAMRHFAAKLRNSGLPLDYVDLESAGGSGLADALENVLRARPPQKLVVCEPGEMRVLESIRDCCARAAVPLEIRPDTHFLISREDFAEWAGGRRELRMELFYREMRRRTGILMNGSQPEGGQWNYDRDNRAGFGRSGPQDLPHRRGFAPDALTREVIELVERNFARHPGDLASFAWPVTRDQALAALEEFVATRLAGFGGFQDAMWTDTPFGWHSLLSCALNLKLLDPREVLEAALQAYRKRALPLASVEGFVRQILGWREFIRGVYWLDMPGLATDNFFGHMRQLPAWYWTGRTRMNCMRHTVGQTLLHGYAHHIQRLMITGNFALLAEIEPRQVCDWYLAVYVDAVEWAELPNTAGMALFANGGRFTSKPYVASGAYIKRMSNYCDGCGYRPDQRVGAKACPVTVLYWFFMDKHADWLARNPRTSLMVRNRNRLSAAELEAVGIRAREILDDLDGL